MIRYLAFLIILISITSCYNSVVASNQYGRKELIHKNYSKKFNNGMETKIDTASVYYRYYENNSIDYKIYTYLRFFSKGQYACFISESDSIIDINNLDKASHIGYYIMNDNTLELETPTGNFNTRSFRVIWDFEISKSGNLLRKGKFPATYIKSKNIDLKPVKPNW